MIRALALLCLVAALLGADGARAHELTMAEMQLRETAHGVFTWQWMVGDKGNPGDVLRALWPDGCHADATTLECGADGLSGMLSVDGVGRQYSAALIKIRWLDGQERVYTVTRGQPTVRLFGALDDPRGRAQIALGYLSLGVHHILTGYDHLLFVLSLLMLVGFGRSLVWSITAFTVAHSLTLASAALELLTLRSPPVEACIALSIVLVAGEALHERATWSRRWPALVAFLFGLVHGLGFAGALKDIGLPQHYLATALLTFNVGVEIGQLMTVSAAWLTWRALRGVPQAARLRAPTLYAIGAVAAYWSWARLALILG